MRSYLLILMLLFAGLNNVHAAEYFTKCDQFPEPLKGGYCAHIPTQNPSGDILYYLHGSGGSEKNWGDELSFTHLIQKEWIKNGDKLPVVIAISFGETWLLAEENSSQYSGLFNVVTEKIIPTAEETLGGLKGKRYVMGQSMGGFNTIQLSLKTDLFDKAAILCSPMSTVSPFAEQKDVEEFIKNSAAYKFFPEKVTENVNNIVSLVKAFFPSSEAWSQADPLTLAAQEKTHKTDFYIAVGYYDEYAAFETNETFVKLLDANASVKWRPQWGGHCAMDIPSLANFFAK